MKTVYENNYATYHHIHIIFYHAIFVDIYAQCKFRNKYVHRRYLNNCPNSYILMFASCNIVFNVDIFSFAEKNIRIKKDIKNDLPNKTLCPFNN